MESLRILVAEDDAMLGMALAEMLEELGHAVCAVESTEAAAVAAAIQYRPQFMIIDVGLGEESGILAVEQIIQYAGHIPHVFMSGDTSLVLKLRPDAVVLRKPFRELELVRAIQQAFGVGIVFP